jgi:hypothetical protein
VENVVVAALPVTNVITVAVNNTSRLYGTTNPDFTVTYSGFVNGDTTNVISGAPVITTSATTNSPVGMYSITAGIGTLSATNYVFSFTNGTLVINPVTLTVTANNTNRLYGATNPVFTVSYNGFVNGDTASVLSGAPSLTTSATTNSPAGNYTITNTIGTLSATNYSFSFTNGLLTVNPAALTVTTTSLPNGTNGMAYNQQLNASGGQTPYSWTNSSGALPSGLILKTNGLISGTPATNGTFNFTVQVTDALSATATQALALTINMTTTTNPPVLAITSPVSGQRWSNAMFTVSGTARDNVGVSDVFYSLDGSAWSPATTANNWSNWTAGVMLTPGTNTVRAYAVDTSGNFSATNPVSFDFVVTNQLQVLAIGLGAISPNYSNSWLEVGRNYTMTATPATGFVFTNWTGGTIFPLTIVSNKATVQFQMASNLVMQANFVDTSRPTLTISSPVAGQRWSNAVFTAKGTASDNWQVANVQYQLNGGNWTNATGTTNWTATVNLTPGTNVLQACAVDTSGNVSTTNQVSFDFVVTNQLQVRATGLGAISPNDSNAWLEVGRNYSIKATPATGFAATNWVISTNWSGGANTNNATVQFMMASNLTLQLNFAEVSRPMLTITAPTNLQKLTNALAHVKGTASDNWYVNQVWYQLNSGSWNPATTTNAWTNWTVTLPLVQGTNTVKAYAVDLGGNNSNTNSVSMVASNTFKLQFNFATTTPMAGNGLNFSLQVSPGINGTIQVSTNLANWLALTNFVGTNSTINFRDSAATNFNRRFYRAEVQ